MNYREYYDKQYLAGEDFQKDESRIYTIKKAESESIESDRGPEDKLVIHFEETDKKYIPGIRMAKVIGSIAESKEVDDWKGVQIQMHEVTEKNFGEMMSVIRIARPVNLDVLDKIKSATSPDQMKQIYQTLTSEEKTSKIINDAMLNQKKSYKKS